MHPSGTKGSGFPAPSIKAASSPAPATPASAKSGVAASPATGGVQPPKPAQQPRVSYGDVYFQPTRIATESQEDYRDRLERISRKAGGVTTKSTPGSFTLLTERNEEGHTGETRFDAEIDAIHKEQKELRQDIDRLKMLLRADSRDKDIYEDLIRRKEGYIRDLDIDIDTLTRAGGEHYMRAKQDETFIAAPRRMNTGNLNLALETAQQIRGKETARKMGLEITSKREKELQELSLLKGVVEEQEKQIGDLRTRLSDLMYGTKKLFEGKMPEHVKDVLIQLEILLKDLDKASETGEPFEPPTNGRLEGMLTTIDELLRGNVFGRDLEEEIRAEMKTPHEALKELMDAGEDITVDALKQKGIGEATAQATIELLKKQGVIS